MLDTNDFSCWETALAATLGHHRSELLSPGQSFDAHLRLATIGSYQVLHIRGHGRLRLNREQQHQSVLWLPLRGMTQECVNGRQWLAEPGQGLLFHPGDAMQGETSEEIEGLSILIPRWPGAAAAGAPSRLLAAGTLSQQLLSRARELASASARQPAGAEHAADAFTEALRLWLAAQHQPQRRERLTARRRRDTVALAREWMATRLQERFTVEELSQAVAVSIRQLQYDFLQELGCSPMAEAKRLRLRRLRQLLHDPEQDQRSVAELMAAAGLVASGVTAADYRRWCGENPSQTRLQRWSDASGRRDGRIALNHSREAERP